MMVVLPLVVVTGIVVEVAINPLSPSPLPEVTTALANLNLALFELFRNDTLITWLCRMEQVGHAHVVISIGAVKCRSGIDILLSMLLHLHLLLHHLLLPIRVVDSTIANGIIAHATTKTTATATSTATNGTWTTARSSTTRN